MSFVTISNKNIFFLQSWGTRLGAIVVHNKGLEYTFKFVVYEQCLIKVPGTITS